MYMKSFLTAVIAFFSLGAFACEPTVPEMTELALRDRKIEEEYVRKLFESADNVVVGLVTDVRNANDPVYAQIAEIEVERIIKGAHSDRISALMYKREAKPPVCEEGECKMTEVISCGAPYDPTQDDPYIIETARALFYIQNGILMRVNSYPIEPALLLNDVNEELRFIDAGFLAPRKDG